MPALPRASGLGPPFPVEVNLTAGSRVMLPGVVARLLSAGQAPPAKGMRFQMGRTIRMAGWGLLAVAAAVGLARLGVAAVSGGARCRRMRG